MELDFAVRQGRTTLAKMQFSGPLRVQRPFYPEAAPTNAPGPSHWRAQVSQPCHCCLLHPPGYSYFSMLRQKLQWSERPKGS